MQLCRCWKIPAPYDFRFQPLRCCAVALLCFPIYTLYTHHLHNKIQAISIALPTAGFLVGSVEMIKVIEYTRLGTWVRTWVHLGRSSCDRRSLSTAGHHSLTGGQEPWTWPVVWCTNWSSSLRHATTEIACSRRLDGTCKRNQKS